MKMKINLSVLNHEYIKKLEVKSLIEFLRSSADYVFTDFNEESEHGMCGIVIKSDRYNAFKLGEVVYFDSGVSYLLSQVNKVGREAKNVKCIHHSLVRHTDKPIVEKDKKDPNKNVAGKDRLPKNLYSAVSFALCLMKSGNERKKAIEMAANYYREPFEDVQSGVAKIAASKRKNIKTNQQKIG
jgi:hypothetical protein